MSSALRLGRFWALIVLVAMSGTACVALDDAMAAPLFDRFGNVGPTIWADGRIVGGWVQRPTGEVALDLMVELSPDQTRALDDAIAELREVTEVHRVELRIVERADCDRCVLYVDTAGAFRRRNDDLLQERAACVLSHGATGREGADERGT